MNKFKKITVSALVLMFALSGTSLAFAENVSSSASDSESVNSSVNLRAGTSVQGYRNLIKSDNSGEVKDSERADKPASIRNLPRPSASAASSSVSADTMVKAKTRADQEINNRIEALNKLQNRVNKAEKISASVKASLSASIQASITEMNNLKAKIDADTDAATLKADIASITASYRIYMLGIPQVQIAVEADRINIIADMMATIGAKAQTRIQAAKDAGKDVTSLAAALSDYNAKIADAKIQAAAALSLSVNLTPDNGDKAKMEANKKALMEARTKLEAGRKDLKAAREDAQIILKGLRSFGDVNVSASSTRQRNPEDSR